MKKLLCILLCLTMLPVFASCKDSSASSVDQDSGETQFGFLWGAITNLPDEFPKISDYVTLASYNSSEKTVHIEWCIASEKMVESTVEALEKWTVSHASTESLDDDGDDRYYLFSKQLSDNIVDILLYYLPSNTGKYIKESNSWESQLVMEVIYSETPTADDTYQLSLTYKADDYTVVHAYKFNGTICSGLSVTVQFNDEASFNEKKQDIIDKYTLAYPSCVTSEYSTILNIAVEQDILIQQLTKADIIVRLQQYGFTQ